MTRKHFEAIATIILYHGPDDALTTELADYFETVNPNFDRARFLAACGVA